MNRTSPGLRGLRAVGACLQHAGRPVALVFVLAWMSVVWQISSMESTGLPTTTLLVWLYNSAHAPLFGLLALWSALVLPREDGWPRLGRRGVLSILAFVFSYGFVDEWHQLSVLGRDSSALDLLTDMVGAVMTLWIIAYVPRAASTEAGLRWRVALALAACALSGGLSTIL
ncbi:MAG TPA: hypothetical protein EYQ59_09635 [Planctomycetes bacterium]|nr:hypothetical protein [Planctomycetota bacterium]